MQYDDREKTEEQLIDLQRKFIFEDKSVSVRMAARIWAYTSRFMGDKYYMCT